MNTKLKHAALTDINNTIFKTQQYFFGCTVSTTVVLAARRWLIEMEQYESELAVLRV